MVESGPTSQAEFEIALNELVVQAYQNGLSFDNGGFVLEQTSEDVPDMEVIFYRPTGDASEK
jgi:hypothetical protein